MAYFVNSELHLLDLGITGFFETCYVVRLPSDPRPFGAGRCSWPILIGFQTSPSATCSDALLTAHTYLAPSKRVAKNAGRDRATTGQTTPGQEFHDMGRISGQNDATQAKSASQYARCWVWGCARYQTAKQREDARHSGAIVGERGTRSSSGGPRKWDPNGPMPARVPC